MIAIAQTEVYGRCTIRYYVSAWAVGTGLQVSLEPGEYRVTGEGDVNGVSFLHLDGAYHCPADLCDKTRKQEANSIPSPTHDRATDIGVGHQLPIDN